MLNERLIVANLVKQYNGEIVAAGEPFATQEQAVALRKGNPEFFAALCKAIYELRADGTLEPLSKKGCSSSPTR